MYNISSLSIRDITEVVHPTLEQTQFIVDIFSHNVDGMAAQAQTYWAWARRGESQYNF